MTSGIYKITNKKNSKFYIGSATNIENRFSRHKSDLKKSRHPNKHLQASWDKYGEDCFIFEILEECEISDLIEREQYYIDKTNPEYNVSRTAGSQLGYRHSQETRQKMSIAKKGHKYGIGRKPTASNIQKIKEALHKRNMQELDNRKKIDYLNLDISDWLEKQKEK